jgi:multidrug resistance efflux pump
MRQRSNYLCLLVAAIVAAAWISAAAWPKLMHATRWRCAAGWTVISTNGCSTPARKYTRATCLYVLDLRPYEAAVGQAKGNLAQSEADLEFARKQVALLQAEANLAVAQANLVKAQQDYDRLTPLVKEEAAAQQELDTAVAALRSGEANVRASQANVDQTRLSTQTQISSTQGKVEAKRAALRTATLNLEYATIRARSAA